MTDKERTTIWLTATDKANAAAIIADAAAQGYRINRTGAISAALAQTAKTIREKESGAMKLHEVRDLFEKVREHLLDLGYSWAEAESAVDMCANADDLERSNLKWLAHASRAQVDEMIALHEAQQ